VETSDLFLSSHQAVIRVYDAAGNVIETLHLLELAEITAKPSLLRNVHCDENNCGQPNRDHERAPPELAVLGVLYALIGAGFYEEFTFRGFLMQGLAIFFGAGRGAWIAACVVQGALFGVAHAYQNPLGIAITGTLGVLMGLLVLASGRNLWLVIIGHGLFDASRFVLFYFEGPPTG
jgi:membrane protease YdiL (CAAX protease family)